jgi:hypothetical protein
MRWPSIIIDDFFNDFKSVVDLSNNVKYHPSDGAWPGSRSEYLSHVNRPFFEMTSYKILQALYPMNYQDLMWSARMQFQKIPISGTGFVHQDDDELSVIIYISGSNSAGGTNLYKPKAFPYNRDGYVNEKFKAYKKSGNKGQMKKDLSQLVNQHNSQFDCTMKVNFLPNRMFAFDCNQQHAAQEFGGERCILIAFFEEIRMRNGSNLKTAVRECKKWG